MGKLIGMCLILGGCAGLLASWRCAQKKRQAQAAELIRLFAQWEYSIERERLRLYEFLEGYPCSQPQIHAFLEALLIELRSKEYPSGVRLWQQLLNKNCSRLNLDRDIWELLWSADGAFFGTSSRESLRCAAACRGRIEECLKRQQTEFLKRQKVYMPVGMLAAVLLIILLI
ncbi:MAG: stage III sporulation protein AB [Blautia sp.]|nr:stage III sporulation protein AB [Blautia sp.]